MNQAPDFSAYIRDDRMIVQILIVGNVWLSVNEPSSPDDCVALAHDVIAAGQHVDHVRITMANPF